VRLLLGRNRQSLESAPEHDPELFSGGERELVYQDTIHFFLSEKTSKLLQKLGVDTMSFSGAEMARLAARSYYDGGTVRGIGPATAKEILDAIEDLYECRANRERVAGS
jgi:hypothetical protein